jgi:translation initiation factor 3 subunit C
VRADETETTEYDKLNRQVVRLVADGKTPKPYIRISAELEDFLNEALAKAKVTPKKMNATQARALNAVKQKIKKSNKDLQKEIDAYRADKDEYMESSEEEAPKPAPRARPAAKDLTVEPQGDDDLDGFVSVGPGGRALQYTPESIFKHLRGIMDTRGKKNTDRVEQIKVMEKLLEIANTPYQQIRVLLTIVSARFDIGTGISNSMPLEHWKAAEKELSQLLTVLDQNHDYIVVENAEEWDDDEKPPTLQEGEKYIKVPGSVVSYVERLDDELVRSLQNIDPHTSEYIERLQDEGALYNIIFRGLLYYEYLQKDETLDVPQDSINRIVMRRLEHVYFKVCIVIPRVTVLYVFTS